MFKNLNLVRRLGSVLATFKKEGKNELKIRSDEQKITVQNTAAHFYLFHGSF